MDYLQYILDDSGKTTGVFIPIERWKELKKNYNIEEDVEKNQFEESVRRFEKLKENPETALDFEDVLNDLKAKYGK